MIQTNFNYVEHLAPDHLPAYSPPACFLPAYSLPAYPLPAYPLPVYSLPYALDFPLTGWYHDIIAIRLKGFKSFFASVINPNRHL